MFLSVIIPSLNRYEYLQSAINDLMQQNYQDFEIIIVDQSDHPQELILKNDQKHKVRVLLQKEKSASLARNYGLHEAKGEVVLYLDDDIIIENRDFLGNHVRHYSDPKRSGVSGAILNTDKKFRNNRHRWSYSRITGWLFFPINYDQPCEIANGWAGNLSVRRKFAIEAGGMDEWYQKGAFREESDFCTRVVKKFGPLIYDPEAWLVHIGAPSGGLRTFKTAHRLRGQHHYDGAMYYLLKNVNLKHYPAHLAATGMIFLGKKDLLKRPHLWALSWFRLVRGTFNATGRLIKGPKHIRNHY
jgi:glycosyltransferase involved in cell wall biosynthesis